MKGVPSLPVAQNTVTPLLTASRIASESVLLGVIDQEQEMIRPRKAAQSKVSAHTSKGCDPAALKGMIWQLGAIPATPWPFAAAAMIPAQAVPWGPSLFVASSSLLSKSQPGPMLAIRSG